MNGQKFLQDTIESYELVREHAVKKKGRRTIGDPKVRQQVLDFLPTAAVQGYLFGAEQCGHVIAMAIAGPTFKPSGLFAFDPEGPMLFCYYALVHPLWRFRQKGIACLKEMLTVAISRYPQCEVLCYFRHDGSAYKQQSITAGGVKWAAARQSESGTARARLSPS